MYPKLKGGKYKIVESVASESVEYMMQELAKRAEAIRAGNVDPTVDNMPRDHQKKVARHRSPAD